MEVTTLADAFLYCPRCGKAATQKGKNPFACTACGFTLFISPITAVAAIVSDSKGKILFLKRANDPGKGKLGLPGGFVDPKERLEDALEREVLEETNLKTTEIEYLTSFPNIYVYKGIKLDVTDMFFRVQVESFDSMLAQVGEVDEFVFVEPSAETLEKMAFLSNRQAVEVFLRRAS